MKFNKERLFAELKKKLFTDKFAGPKGSKQIAGIDNLIDEAEKRDTPIDDLAYILATVYWETDRTMQPIKEAGSEAYLKSKKYYPYYGRGYVQLTWDYNYKKVGDKYGIDAINNPDIVMQEPYATDILFDGMNEGWFSGKKLHDYIDDVNEGDVVDEQEYENARMVVNGSDKKKTIADFGIEWRRCLNAAWVTNTNPLPKSTTVPAGAVGGVAGASLLVDPIKALADALNGQKDAFTSGNLLVLLAGVLIVGAAAYVVWARWDAAGRPKLI